MKINAEITSNRELKINVDLSTENEGSSSGNPNVWVSGIEIFNTKSYLDNASVYYKEYDSTGTGVFPNPFVITDHDMNTFDSVVNTEHCHPTDIYNDIIIANVSFGYNTQYEANATCCSDTPASRTIVIYYSCPLYDNAIKAIGGCNCKDMCEENLPYGFMYALLKKKAIDMCLECGHYDMACRYYIKFFKTDDCNCQKKGCGCGNGSSSSSGYTATTNNSTTTKNCGCNG